LIMVTIKIEIGVDREHVKKKKEHDIKKAALLAALVDSIVWMADTALLLKLFYGIPLYPFGGGLIAGVFFLYFAYLIMKARILVKKFGKEIYGEEFGHTGILLAAVSAGILFLLIVISYL